MPHKDPEARRAYRKAYSVRTKEANAARCRRWYERNAQVAIDRTAAWRVEHPGCRSRQHRSARYGLTPADLDRMHAEQGGLCAICGYPPDGKASMAILHVDHDHNTGKVRALLCQKCNKGLGTFRDNPAILQKAAWYLLRHKAVGDVA